MDSTQGGEDQGTLEQSTEMVWRFKNFQALRESADTKKVTPEEALKALEDLTEKPTPSQLALALGRFKEAIHGMSDLSRELAREAAVKRLRALGVASPGRIVDTAMPPRPTDETKPGSAIFFKEADLWPEPVDGAGLLAAFEETITRYVALSPEQVPPLALWALFAHVHDAFEISPILAITSPDKGCGKSTLLAILGALVPRPLPSSSITPSAVFRVTDCYKPTLLLDEADTFLGDSEGLRGILNSGHMRSHAFVTRVVGENHHVCLFSTWAPKAIAMIGELPPTLADRSVTVRMKRRSPKEPVQRLQLHKLAEFEELRSKAARWAKDHFDELVLADPALPEGITRDRIRDNWRPLLAIADRAGGDWPRRARESAGRLAALAANDPSLGVTLLGDLQALFESSGEARLGSEEILLHLHQMVEREWPEWRNRGPISAQQVAGILRPFAILPAKWKQEGVTYRGYFRADFEDAFSRYLPSDPPPPPPASEQRTYATNGVATEEDAVATFGTGNSSNLLAVAAVATRDGGLGGEGMPPSPPEGLAPKEEQGAPEPGGEPSK